MKIVHLCIQCPYNDYWGYQDNLLPKYQIKMGHDVTVITTNTMHDDSGKIVETDCGDYRLTDGQRIIRLKRKKIMSDKISKYIGYYDYYNLLCEIKPDFIMVHGLGNFSNIQIRKYLKEVDKSCIVIADNHLDYNIGNPKKSLKVSLYYKILKPFSKYMQKYYTKVYGVTPWRKEYCEDVFGISPAKTDVLIMGADDEKIDFENRDIIRQDIRKKHGVLDDDFLIITGGKIDKNKNIHLLMQAVAGMDNPNVRLIVFGNCVGGFSDTVNSLTAKNKVDFIGWVPAEKTYEYFLASDLAIFPGQHSVLWEQACACGIPTVFKYYTGMDHVDVSGNCRFLYKDSVDEIKALLSEICDNKQIYDSMKKNAVEKREKFLYSKIAEKSLECFYNN